MNPAASSSSAGGTQAMDLNYRLVCKDCQQHPPNIVEDYKNGDLICGDCGLVFPMRIIDLKSEWRNFSSETGGSGDDPSRTGAAENPLLDGIVDQLTTTISGRDNYTGQSRAYQKTQNKVSVAQKGDRDIVTSFKMLGVMAERIGLPKAVADTARHLYKKVFDEDHAKGKPNDGLVAACLFLACRQEKVPRTFKEITTLTRVDKKTIAKCVKAITPLIEERVESVKTEDYVARFCSHLDLGVRIQHAAAHVVHRAGFLGILAGKSPLSVCAAAIYFTCWLLAGNTGEGTSGTTGTPGTTGKPTTTLTDGSMDPKKLRKTLRDISPVAGVNESTIKNAYKDLWASRREVTEGLSVPGFPYFGTPAPPAGEEAATIKPKDKRPPWNLDVLLVPGRDDIR